ncbi:MAG: NIPSNAP family protein [Chloroflexi bacterium]|nr:NIPSNAP family protein [Chloroflexota bacterium]
MIYEYRVYHALPGKLPALNARFAEITLPLFQKHGIQVVGFWETVIGTSNTLHYLLAYRDLAHREQAWSSFQSDPEWQQARAATEVDGPLVEYITNTILRPTPYSPMQ